MKCEPCFANIWLGKEQQKVKLIVTMKGLPQKKMNVISMCQLRFKLYILSIRFVCFDMSLFTKLY